MEKEEDETEVMQAKMKRIEMTGSKRLRRSNKSAESIKDGWSNERRNDKSVGEKDAKAQKVE